MKCILLVEEKVFSWLKRRCTHLAKGICQVVFMVVILGVQNQVKGKSQAGGLETGCRSQGPNQDKSLCLRLSISEI